MDDFIYTPMAATDAFKFFAAKRRQGIETFNYRDLESKAHAVAFTVAKSSGQDVLDTIYTGLQQTFRNHGTYQDFKNAVTPELKNKGWWGPRVMTDTKTGEVINAQLGSERRLQIIFNTNIRTAFAAGQWAEIESLKKQDEQVFLEYQAVDDDRTRPTHKAKDNLILPMDDPFWDYWYPPNGWRCRCWVNVLTKNAMDALNLKPSSSPELKGRMVTNTRRDDETEWVPYGVDPSFNFNVGKEWLRPYTPIMQDHKIEGLASNLAKDFKFLKTAPQIQQIFNDKRILPSSDQVRKIKRLEKLEESEAEKAIKEYYALKFLNAFGVKKLDGHTLFTDVTGTDLIISKSMLSEYDPETQTRTKLKSDKEERGQYMLLLADTLKNPDNIYKYKRGIEKRTYLKTHYTSTGEVYALSAFVLETKTREWEGVTTFDVKRRENFIEKHKGTHLYPEEDKK